MNIVFGGIVALLCMMLISKFPRGGTIAIMGVLLLIGGGIFYLLSDGGIVTMLLILAIIAGGIIGVLFNSTLTTGTLLAIMATIVVWIGLSLALIFNS